MRRLVASCLALVLVLPASGLFAGLGAGAAYAQSNDNDYTPLNSRIRRKRQFPTEPRNFLRSAALGEASRSRSRRMEDQFAACLWDRSNEKGRDLLSRTDFGFVNFEQIGIDANRLRDLYPIRTCLRRVANTNNSGVSLRYTADAMRRWYIQGAYLNLYEDGPSWVQGGYEVTDREYPLSAQFPPVQAAMNLADCIVVEDPYTSDYLYRTADDSDQEGQAIQALLPAISACIPEGQQIEITPLSMRIWLGEALWHAANNSVPPSEEIFEEEQ